MRSVNNHLCVCAEIQLGSSHHNHIMLSFFLAERQRCYPAGGALRATVAAPSASSSLPSDNRVLGYTSVCQRFWLAASVWATGHLRAMWEAQAARGYWLTLCLDFFMKQFNHKSPNLVYVLHENNVTANQFQRNWLIFDKADICSKFQTNPDDVKLDKCVSKSEFI